MIDENKLHKEMLTGATAKQELRVTADAFEAVAQHYVDAWMKSDVRDTAGREKLWVATTILSLVQRQLRAYVDTGKMAEAEIEKIKRAAERKRLFDLRKVARFASA